MSMGLWILRDKVPYEAADITEWGDFFHTVGNRTVARDELPGGIVVSTVFLGIDHGYSPDGPPILFETMVFGGPLNGEQERYSTWAEAEAGHAAMLKRVLECHP